MKCFSWIAILGAIFFAVDLAAEPATDEPINEAIDFSLPDAWQDVGTVETWARLDSHFHRISGTEGAAQLLSYNFEQKSVYAATRLRGTGLARIDLAGFLDLTERDQ